MLFFDRIEVIDSLKITRLDALASLLDGFFNCLLHAIHGFDSLTSDFNFFSDLFVRPIHTGHVGEEIEL